MAALTPLNDCKCLVVKIGSALLVDAETGKLRYQWLQALAQDIADLKAKGTDVLVVSSGSIALGRRVLGLSPGILSLEHSQAAAAVGQIKLARAYEEVLSPLGLHTAQVLMTLDDSRNRRRYLNSRATVSALLSFGVVPIVNENDTVATDEIRFGDNDRLAAQVASMVGADVLVLLSDVDGFYTGNPKEDPSAAHMPVIEAITPELEAMAGGAGTAGAKGGMATKIMAAKTAMQAGCDMAIMQGDMERPLKALAEGVKCSWFIGHGDPQAARKKWISGLKPQGTLTIDAGAARALANGKSLLPAGVSAVSGRFDRGDVVVIQDEKGRELARGLVTYSAADARAIAGRQSSEIKSILGYPGRAALVHRDDMAM